MMLCSCEGRHEAKEMAVLSSEVYQMRQCQRKAENLNFYLHKYRAEKIIDEYRDDYSSLNDSSQRQFMRASTRYAIVYSDYLLQIGNSHEAIKMMDDLASSNIINLNADTLLWLNYLSHQGAVRFIPVNLNKNRKNIEKGYDCLMQCYILAARNNIPLYQGVAMQLLSQYLVNKGIFSIVKNFDAASLRYINEDSVPDSLLAGNLAERALNIFLQQKDAYLTVGAWRNLAECYFNIGEPFSTVNCLSKALAYPELNSMPDLKASVSEQMSMAYAALNDKNASDYYRNLYLDLQDSTRQDRELQARVIEMQKKNSQIWILVGVAISLFLSLCLAAAILVILRRRKLRMFSASEDEMESLHERLSIDRLQYSDAQRTQVELRAQVSVINGVLPLIERMRNAIQRGDIAYAREIADDIDTQNALLTKWIKLRQGAIAPKIESFAINDVFDVIRQKENGRISKENAEVSLNIIVKDTNAIVKADRTLTLFIVNTLIENARNAIDKNGTITVSCNENHDGHFAEITVSDTGKGMNQEQLDHLFEVKPITDDHLIPHPSSLRSSSAGLQGKNLQPSSLNPQSHGFGLQNCRGIINRYRKISNIFSVCDIIARSVVGKGTAISFRLPLVVKVLAVLLSFAIHLSADSKVEQYADSLYKNNVEGHYADAMYYADSCIAIIEANSKAVRIETRLSVFNETAVAALALHQWQKYIYYNYIYTNLYKEYTEDKSLPEYIQKIHRSKMIANIILLLIILLFIALVPVFWYIYMRPIILTRKELRRQKKSMREECAVWESKTNRLHVMNNVVSNQLSTVKHETMYYPPRISQMMSQNEDREELLRTVSYYSRLYSLLSNSMIAGQLSSSLFSIRNLDNSQFTTLNPQLQGLGILGNEELLAYLLLLLKRHNGGSKPNAEITNPSDRYVTISFLMDRGDFSEQSIPKLFTIGTIHTDYIVMRQIMREIGSASMCYGTGITAMIDVCSKKINVTLPKVFRRNAQ